MGSSTSIGWDSGGIEAWRCRGVDIAMVDCTRRK